MRKQILYLRRGASEQDENKERKKLRHCEQGAASVSAILFFFFGKSFPLFWDQFVKPREV